MSVPVLWRNGRVAIPSGRARQSSSILEPRSYQVYRLAPRRHLVSSSGIWQEHAKTAEPKEINTATPPNLITEYQALIMGCDKLVGLSKRLPGVLATRDPSAIPPEWEEVIARLSSAIQSVHAETTCNATVIAQIAWLITYIAAPERLPERDYGSERMRLSLLWTARLIENGVKTGESHLKFDRDEFLRHNGHRLARPGMAEEAKTRRAKKAEAVSRNTTSKEATSTKSEPKASLAVASNEIDLKPAPLVKTLSKKVADVAKTTIKLVAPTLAEPPTTSPGQKSKEAKHGPKKDSTRLQSQLLELDLKSPFIMSSAQRDEAVLDSGSVEADTSNVDNIGSEPRVRMEPVQERASSSAVSAEEMPIDQQRRKQMERDDALLLAMSKSEQTTLATLATRLIAIIKVRRSSRVLKPAVRAGELYKAGDEISRPHQISRPVYLLRMAIKVANGRVPGHLKSDDMKKWFAENHNAYQQVMGMRRRNRRRQRAETVNLESTDKPAMSQNAELSTSAVHSKSPQEEDLGAEAEKPLPPLSKNAKKKLKTLTPRNRPSTRPARAVRIPKRSTRAVASRSPRTATTLLKRDTATATSVEVPAAQVDAALQSVDQAEEINRLYRPGPRRPEEALSSSSTPPPGYEAVAKRERRIREARAAQGAATARLQALNALGRTETQQALEESMPLPVLGSTAMNANAGVEQPKVQFLRQTRPAPVKKTALTVQVEEAPALTAAEAETFVLAQAGTGSSESITPERPTEAPIALSERIPSEQTVSSQPLSSDTSPPVEQPSRKDTPVETPLPAPLAKPGFLSGIKTFLQSAYRKFLGGAATSAVDTADTSTISILSDAADQPDRRMQSDGAEPANVHTLFAELRRNRKDFGEALEEELGRHAAEQSVELLAYRDEFHRTLGVTLPPGDLKQQLLYQDVAIGQVDVLEDQRRITWRFDHWYPVKGQGKTINAEQARKQAYRTFHHAYNHPDPKLMIYSDGSFRDSQMGPGAKFRKGSPKYAGGGIVFKTPPHPNLYRISLGTTMRSSEEAELATYLWAIRLTKAMLSSGYGQQLQAEYGYKRVIFITDATETLRLLSRARQGSIPDARTITLLSMIQLEAIELSRLYNGIDVLGLWVPREFNREIQQADNLAVKGSAQAKMDHNMTHGNKTKKK